MPSDNQIVAIVQETRALADALHDGKTLGDILAVRLLALDLWIRFAAESSSSITTGQLERILDARIAFSQRNSPQLHAFLNRPGIAPCFSRTVLGRRTPEVRRLPRELRSAIAHLPDSMLRLTTYATNLTSDVIIDVVLLCSLDLLPEDAATLLQFNLPSAAIKNPGILLSLPAQVKGHLSSSSDTRAWFSRSHPLVQQFASTREPIIIDVERACGRARLALLRALYCATETRSADAVRTAMRCLKSEAWFFSASETTPLPGIDLAYFDDSLTLSAIIRHVRKGEILYDHGEYAVFDTITEPTRRYFLRFPSYPRAFVSESTGAFQEEYLQAPLRFVINHSAERSRSELALGIRSDLNQLEGFRREVGVAATAEWLSTRITSLTSRGIAALPQSVFAASAYFLVAHQLGFHDAPTIAALEGFVHLIIRTLGKGVRTGGH